MSQPVVVFERVWKKFRRGERHDSLRDVIPSAARQLLRRQHSDALQQQEFWALQDVSFKVERGETLGIIGPNGAGKSTALKLLTKILRPTSGHCGITGRVGALIEVAAGFHPDLTGLENIYLQGAIFGMKRPEIRRRLDSIIDFAGVGDFIQTPVKRYSSGMQARLGFAIAAHIDPDVLLIDEVLSVGDTAFQRKCERRMEEFREQGVAIVFVSHNLNAVLQLCSRALLLNGGRIKRTGRTDDVVATYNASDSAGELTATKHDGGASLAVRVQRNGSSDRDGIMVVAPGERISLEVDVQFHVSVRRAVVYVVVWDMTRNFYAYGASSESVGIPPIRAEAGDQLNFEFSLVTHLTRGVYSIEVNVFDPDHQRSNLMAVLRSAKPFRISEERSHHGLANLYLSGSIRPARSESSLDYSAEGCT